MSSLYIGIYKALYDYEAQADEELSIHADDLLYLLEKSDVDEWWKVKKRVVASGNEEVDEPSGLVPSNYIEEAPVLKTANALYDYDKQTEEELSFKEGEQFLVYDLSDQDWYLVGDSSKTAFGFIPSNYVEFDESNGPVAPQVGSQNQQSISQPEYFSMAPPKHPDQLQGPDSPPRTPQRESQPEPVNSRIPHNKDFEEEAPPPPMPSRPSESNLSTNGATSPHGVSQYEEEEDIRDSQEHNFDGDFFTWYLNEVDGRKKRAVVFSIGKGLIILKPNTSNPKRLSLKSASSLDHEWRIRDLLDYSHEKKHLFLEFKNPKASIELHTGTKDVAEAIVSILGDLKGAEDARGLKEVAKASQASTGASNRKIGRLVYDFEAQGEDELDCKEGDEVYIVDETKSKEWWMCENIDNGRQGVIPSSYIEIIGTSNLEKLTDMPQRRKSSKGRVVDSNSSNGKGGKVRRHHGRDERERLREKDRAKREKMATSSKDNDKDQSLPNFHRVRTWIDSTGSFKVEAEFLGCVEGKIHLHKTNGVKIAVAATKLSIEDLEYVEKVTGTSLESYKNEVIKQSTKRAKKSSGVSSTPSATAVINDIAPSQPTRPKARSSESTKEPEYDWFDFFLACGIDIGNCQRYTLNFNREQMDESILEDITPSLLRTLGLREGDILRIMKYLDNKFDRKKSTDEPKNTGGLFTEPSGELKKNNSSNDVPKVDAKALPSPEKQYHSDSTQEKRFEDDAWAVKPAARSNEDLLKVSSQPQTPQFTGSLQDLVNVKPIVNNTGNNVLPKEQNPSAPSLTPSKTGPSIQQSGQQYAAKSGSQLPYQSTGNLVPVQKTGTLIPVQRTGASLAAQPTGLVTAQPTGFIPITAQPTGFIPIQQTGGLQPQFTFGIIPLQTGSTNFTAQKTGPQQANTGFGPPPVTSFGQPFQPNIVPLQTGPVTMPQTTFGESLSLQRTGPLVPAQRTGGVPPSTSFSNQLTGQPTGPMVSNQRTGGAVPGAFVPQSSFGQQITGGFNQQSQATGGYPQNSFGIQAAGGYTQTSFGGQATGGTNPSSFISQVTGGYPQNSFGNQGAAGYPQTSFGGQASGGFPQTNFGPGATPLANGFPQTTFGVSQQPTMNSFNSFPQQQNSYGSFAPQPPNMNQITGMFQNTSIGGQPPQYSQMPQTSFGQPQFDGFSQPLQSQPTGAGFGNAPLQPQQTGKRANLQAATPDNPFGF